MPLGFLLLADAGLARAGWQTAIPGISDPAKANFDKYLHEESVRKFANCSRTTARRADLVRYAAYHYRGAKAKNWPTSFTRCSPSAWWTAASATIKATTGARATNEIPVKVLDYDWETPVTTK